MTTADLIEDAVVSAIHEVAPEAAAIPPDANLRDELELDSTDLRTIFVGIEKRLGVTVPEADYAHLQTLGGMLAYLREKQLS